MTEEDIDFQIGASDVDRNPVTSSGEFIEFEMETRAVFTRLAEDIYPSPKSGLRESMTNAVTATIEAVEKYDLERKEAVVRYKLVDNKSNGRLLIIEDNGIGMTTEKIRSVVSYIGRSTVRDDSEKAGQFGMGFLALFSLCGTDGGFVMHTNSRKPDTEAITGIWKDGGFSKEDTMDRARDMFGTRFEIYLRDEVTSDDVREWVSNVAQWSRVPIMYEEEREESSYSEEFGGTKIEDRIPSDTDYVSYEDEFVKVVSSPYFDEDSTILLDVPVDKGVATIPHTEWNCVTRLKTEQPTIMSDEDRGKMVVSEVEYKGMSDERREPYVPKSEVSEDAIVTPEVIGNREKLSKNNRFWDFVGRNIKEEHIKNVEEYVGQIDSGDIEPTGSEWDLITSLIPSTQVSMKNFHRICSKMFRKLSDSQIEMLFSLTRETKIVTGADSSKIGNNWLHNRDYIFMTTGHIKDEKREIVEKNERNCEIVEVPSSEWYDFYEETLGWHRLSNIDNNHEVTETVTGISRDNERDTEEQGDKKANHVTIHSNRNRRLPIENLSDYVKEDSEGAFISSENIEEIRTLYLIKSSSNLNVSDYDWMGQIENVGVVQCDCDAYNKIAGLPVSIQLSDKIEELKNEEVLTSEGYTKHGDITKSSALYHIMPEDDINRVIGSSVDDCRKVSEILSMENSIESITAVPFETYIPITEDDFVDILPLLSEADIMTNKIFVNVSTFKGPRPRQCILYKKMYDYRDSDIIRKIDDNVIRKEDKETTDKFLRLMDEISSSDIDLDKVINNE